MLYTKRNSEITKLFQMGLSYKFIADQYGIGWRQVRKIVSRSTK